MGNPCLMAAWQAKAGKKRKEGKKTPALTSKRK